MASRHELINNKTIEIVKILTVDTLSSTNSYLADLDPEPEGMTLVRAVNQTGGRGQRGNSWESEPGKNMTFSILYHPEGVAPAEQFSISEAVALGICDYLQSERIEARVKWPNDIYVGNKKICGILIEHTIMGPEISRTIIGVGINVNQKIFRSDAPNPVSMTMITGKEYDPAEETEAVAGYIKRRLDEIVSVTGREEIHREFLKKLWRGDGGEWPFRERETGKTFAGIIRDVERNGKLVVEESATGRRKGYFFKEVEFLLG